MACTLNMLQSGSHGSCDLSMQQTAYAGHCFFRTREFVNMDAFCTKLQLAFGDPDKKQLHKGNCDSLDKRLKSSIYTYPTISASFRTQASMMKPNVLSF